MKRLENVKSKNEEQLQVNQHQGKKLTEEIKWTGSINNNPSLKSIRLNQNINDEEDEIFI